MSVILEATRQGTQPVAFINLVSSRFFREEKEIRDKVRAFLYPFPEENIKVVIGGYPNFEEIVWGQEEPKNMGAWTFMDPRLRQIAGAGPPSVA